MKWTKKQTNSKFVKHRERMQRKKFERAQLVTSVPPLELIPHEREREKTRRLRQACAV